MNKFCESTIYNVIVTLTICVSAIAAGLETNLPQEGDEETESAWEFPVFFLNQFVLTVFASDVFFKLLAEPYFWTYFYDDWNKFDVFIVILSFIPSEILSGSYLVALKLLRLLRLLKLVKRFKTLEIILEALVSTAKSIVMICGLMFVFVLVLASIGQALFAENDPLHFGNIRLAFVTMFQILTCDSWSTLMYINMFGCDVMGDDPTTCTPKKSYLVSILFFTASVAILTWIMVTMFIGVLTTGYLSAMFTSLLWILLPTLIRNFSSDSTHPVKYE